MYSYAGVHGGSSDIREWEGNGGRCFGNGFLDVKKNKKTGEGEGEGGGYVLASNSWCARGLRGRARSPLGVHQSAAQMGFQGKP